MSTPFVSQGLRLIQRTVFLLAAAAATPFALASDFFQGPTNGTGGLAPGVHQVTIAGQPAQIIVGTNYNPAKTTYLCYYLHGDEGGYDAWVNSGVHQFVNQHGLVMVAPQCPLAGGAHKWDANGNYQLQLANAQQIADTLDFMFTKYNVYRHKLLGTSASGGSWFYDFMFFPQNGQTYPTFFNLGCGGFGMTTQKFTYPDAVAVSQNPVAKALTELKFTIGTEDFLFDWAQTSAQTYMDLGFSVRTNFIAGAEHCAYDLAQTIVDYWTEALAHFESTNTPATLDLGLRAAKVTATGSVQLTWNSTPGTSYIIQVSGGPMAAANDWQNLITVPAAVAPATSTSYTEIGTLFVAGRKQRFYRIGVAP